MRLSLPQRELQQATAVVSALVGRSATPMPVLNNLLLVGEKGVITLEGTDIETQVVATIPGKIEREGRATIEAGRFASLVKLFPAGSDVVIDCSDGKAMISSDGNEYKLLTLPVDEFPEWTREEAVTTIRLAQKELKYLFGAAEYAVAGGKDGRRVLFGIQTQIRDNSLRMTATDGKKLSRVWRNVGEVIGKPDAEIIIPAKPAAELRKALADEGPVEVRITPRQIFFSAGNFTWRTQSIEGRYPDCDAVIPKDLPHVIDFDRDRFMSSVRRAGIVASDVNRSILMKIADNVCEFQSMAHDVGSFSGKMPMQYSGEPLRVAFNCEYLLETVGGFADPQIKMFIKNATAPVIFRSDKEPERLSLLMPIKLTAVPSPDDVADDGDE